MKSIKEHGLPKSDETYMVLSPHYQEKPFEAYLDDNGDWHDARVHTGGLGFIFYEVTHYCTIEEYNDNRMNIIARNGNTGEHYN